MFEFYLGVRPTDERIAGDEMGYYALRPTVNALAIVKTHHELP